MATNENSGDDGEVDVSVGPDDVTIGEVEALSILIASHVVTALQANAPFTTEVIAQIIDHVSPNGVAYKNGRVAGLKEAADFVRRTGGGMSWAGIVNCLETDDLED